MKLITKAIENKLLKHPLGSTDGKKVKDVIVKFFNPCGPGTWYVFEGEKHGDDWMFFGLVDLSEKELGYFNLSHLELLSLPWGMHVERDMYFTGYKYYIETNEIK